MRAASRLVFDARLRSLRGFERTPKRTPVGQTIWADPLVGAGCPRRATPRITPLPRAILNWRVLRQKRPQLSVLHPGWVRCERTASILPVRTKQHSSRLVGNLRCRRADPQFSACGRDLSGKSYAGQSFPGSLLAPFRLGLFRAARPDRIAIRHSNRELAGQDLAHRRNAARARAPG